MVQAHLYGFYTWGAIERLAQDLKTSPEHLMALVERRKGISPELARRLRYLWQIKLGKVKVEVPKPPIEPPKPPIPLPLEVEVKKCSFFSTQKDEQVNDFLVPKTGTPVFGINQRDILTEVIEENEYDGALEKARVNIDKIFGDFINGRIKIFEVQYFGGISYGILEEDKCSSTRKYEFESFRISAEKEFEYAYALNYSKGVVEDVGFDKLPEWVISRMVGVLRWVGVWEK